MPEKGESIQHVYFLDMAMCLDLVADREDVVVSVPATLKKSSDVGDGQRVRHRAQRGPRLAASIAVMSIFPNS